MQNEPYELDNQEPQIRSNVVKLREAVGVFPDDEHLMAAIDDLEMAEFNRQDISVLGSEAEMMQTYHSPYVSPYRLEDDPRAPRGVFVMPEEQSLAEAALVGAGVILAIYIFGPMMGPDLSMAASVVVLLAIAAAGGALGYAAAIGLRRMRHRRMVAQKRRGGLLLWVSTPTRDREEKATAILSRHGARDVHVNETMRQVA